MFGSMRDTLRTEIDGLREASLYKTERVIVSPQGPVIRAAVPGGANHARSSTSAPTTTSAWPTIRA